MPYIDQPSRDRLADGDVPRNAGEVNYLVTLLMNSYLTDYQSSNEIAEGIEYVINDLMNKEYCAHPSQKQYSSEFHSELVKIVMTSDVYTGQVVGALRNAFAEFYARKVRPYEDLKIKQNGDV